METPLTAKLAGETDSSSISHCFLLRMELPANTARGRVAVLVVIAAGLGLGGCYSDQDLPAWPWARGPRWTAQPDPTGLGYNAGPAGGEQTYRRYSPAAIPPAAPTAP